MEGCKLILWLLLGVAALVATYLYVRHLSDSGYEDRDIYLHIFHDIPLWLLKKKDSEDIYSGSPYSGHVPEYRKAEEDLSESYPSFYGANYNPNTAAQRNAPPMDFAHNQRILASGGWQCACGKVHAAYVSSCACGRSKSGDLPAEPAPTVPEEPTEDTEVRNAQAIREYKKLMDEGIITAEEFEAKKKQLLGL